MDKFRESLKANTTQKNNARERVFNKIIKVIGEIQVDNEEEYFIKEELKYKAFKLMQYHDDLEPKLNAYMLKRAREEKFKGDER